LAKIIGFYQNFNLDLQRLSNARHYIQQDPEMSHFALAQYMSVNQPVAEGFSAWLRHSENYCLSGRLGCYEVSMA
jgi:hypothetical protein